MRVHSLFTVLAVAASVVSADEVDIPWLKSVIASMTEKFDKAVTYAGPTGTALAAVEASGLTGTAFAEVKASATAVPTIATTTTTTIAIATAIATTTTTTIAIATAIATAVPKIAARAATPYWLEQIAHQGISAFNTNPATYQVFRNVKSFGAKGDGVTDDTAAINAAMSAGGRCAPGSCQSTTTTPAILYFPAGTYLISSSIIDYYYTQMIGNPNDMPILKATGDFTGFGLIDGDRYGPGGVLQFGATNTFYRQVRNFIFDMRAIPSSSEATGIHWPTAQATSLQNCVFKMADVKDTKHRGLFIEAGSGGFMNDLTFYGGLQGVVFGNQQFTVRNLTFYNAVTAIDQIWDWGWTYSQISINNCSIGLDMSSGGAGGQTVGSVTFLDSTITNTKIGILTAHNATSLPATAGSLVIDNVQLNNVVNGVQGPQGILITGGTKLITGFRQGHSYVPGSTAPQTVTGTISPFPRPASLLTSNKRFYSRSKPQYENLPLSSFVSVRSKGAKGDGKTDDAAVLNTILKNAAAAGQVVFFDAGTYRVTQTLYVPPGSKIVGESFSVIIGWGALFTNINAPQPVVKVGNAGETGVVEWSDMIVSTRGALKGAILIQWNLNSSPTTPSGMWDVHTRIGGFAGSNLLYADCAATKNPVTAVDQDCVAAFMSLHLGKTSRGLYMENVWLWTADHDIEDATLRQITVYAGRGIYSESTLGNFWFVGTASEHHTFYQYQFANTPNVYMGQIQTETAYYQPNPKAETPFPALSAWNDPNFKATCTSVSGNCEDGWGLRIINSTNIFVYGAGLYSFFNNYSTTCSDAGQGASCQTRIFSIEGSLSKNIGVYNLNTIGSQQMITINGAAFASYAPNQNVYPQSIALFRNYNP